MVSNVVRCLIQTIILGRLWMICLVHIVKAVVMERIIVQILVMAWASAKCVCLCLRGVCVWVHLCTRRVHTFVVLLHTLRTLSGFELHRLCRISRNVPHTAWMKGGYEVQISKLKHGLRNKSAGLRWRALPLYHDKIAQSREQLKQRLTIPRPAPRGVALFSHARNNI